jgi:hypothetical protein
MRPIYLCLYYHSTFRICSIVTPMSRVYKLLRLHICRFSCYINTFSLIPPQKTMLLPHESVPETPHHYTSYPISLCLLPHKPMSIVYILLIHSMVYMSINILNLLKHKRQHNPTYLCLVVVVFTIWFNFFPNRTLGNKVYTLPNKSYFTFDSPYPPFQHYILPAFHLWRWKLDSPSKTQATYPSNI